MYMWTLLLSSHSRFKVLKAVEQLVALLSNQPEEVKLSLYCAV